jgi:MarR family transcriptional regulator, organic hydroperoxide resistance regulator
MHHPSCDPPQLPADASPSATAVFGAFMRAMHSQRQLMARKMASHGIPPAQMFCLREVAHSSGITQRDLAEKLNVSRPTLTVMLHKMEKSGLIERRPDESDQRFTRISLASGGAKVHDEMHGVIGEVIAEMIGPMPEVDRAELARLLTDLSDNMTNAALETPEKADR